MSAMSSLQVSQPCANLALYEKAKIRLRQPTPITSEEIKAIYLTLF